MPVLRAAGPIYTKRNRHANRAADDGCRSRLIAAARLPACCLLVARAVAENRASRLRPELGHSPGGSRFPGNHRYPPIHHYRLLALNYSRVVSS